MSKNRFAFSYPVFALPTSKSLRLHYLLLGCILLLGGLLRFWHLSSLPNGLHGDEGIVGYEARRILNQGYIGPYSTVSFGQPTGPIYLTALAVRVWGNEIIAVRFVPALVGTLSILALYGLVRRAFDRKTALVSALLLATLVWHIHFARIGFPLESWPFICILIALGIVEATKSNTKALWGLTAFLSGLGFYVYKAHPLFYVLATGWVAVALWQSAQSNTKKAGFFALYLAISLITASLLIRAALDPRLNFNNQLANNSTFVQPEWLALTTPLQKTSALVGRYFEFWNRALFASLADASDGAAIAPFISLPLTFLAAVGFCWFKRREPLLMFSRVVVLTMPLANVVTVSGFARRTFALAPFLCVLAAVGAMQLIAWGQEKRLAGRLSTPALVATLLAAHVVFSWNAYFRVFANNANQAWIFCDELTQSLDYMKTLPPGTPIYFYSGRWSIDYDTRKYLAPALNALDCSQQTRKDKKTLWPQPQPGQKAVWVLLDVYEPAIDGLQREFPGGLIKIGPYSLPRQGPAFIAYER